MAGNIMKLADITPVALFSLNGKTTNICHITMDITKLQVGCIVNAANSSLLGGGGVDGAIHRAAGRGLLEECRKLGGCATGDAKITDAYNLPCEKVVHTVGPVYDAESDPARVLGSCYTRSLEVAAGNKLKSIAFSAISTGVYGYPSKEAASVALDAVKRFLEKSEWHFSHVLFCTFVQNDVKAYEELIPRYFNAGSQDAAASSCTSRLSKDLTSHTPQELATRLPDVPDNDPGASADVDPRSESGSG